MFYSSRRLAVDLNLGLLHRLLYELNLVEKLSHPSSGFCIGLLRYEGYRILTAQETSSSYFSQTDISFVSAPLTVTFMLIRICVYRVGFVIHRRFIPLADETPGGSDFRKQYVVVKQSAGTCASVGNAAFYVADKISRDDF